ncbi:MAG: hypothetical protein CMJ28_07965 [Phycisphaerae bacterium]|nr:hypothetical protein [Phycisphaerae bacterium]
MFSALLLAGGPLPPIVPELGAPRPPWTFSDSDEALLESAQFGAFRALTSVTAYGGMVRDSTNSPVISLAGVGFQLAALALAPEHDWLTELEAETRTLNILQAVLNTPDIAKHGLYYHWIDATTGAPRPDWDGVSTVDSALFYAGAMVAASRFGGFVDSAVNELILNADWSKFVLSDEVPSFPSGYLSLAWEPNDEALPTGEGELLPYAWVDAMDEERLTVFLAQTQLNPNKTTDPDMWWTLRRPLGITPAGERVVYSPYSGAFFRTFYAQLFLDTPRMGPDNPSEHGFSSRTTTDFWENTRRHAQMHRDRAINNPNGLPTLGPVGWPLTASLSPNGYAVPGVFPTVTPIPGAERPQDEPSPGGTSPDDGDGTIAAYGAAGALLFDLQAMDVLRHARDLTQPLVWNEPAVGGFGYRDAWNEGNGGWSATKHISIDDGALLLAIENARTGRVWSLFHQHPYVQIAMDRIGLERRSCVWGGCPEDVDRDCTIGFSDLLAVLSSWGFNPGNPADVNQDNAVEFSDLLAVLSAIGPCEAGELAE